MDFTQHYDSIVRTMSLLGGVFALVSLVIAAVSASRGSGPTFRSFLVFSAVIWTVLPPLWLWFEYFHLYAPSEVKKYSLEEFQYGQKLVGAMWLSVLTVVALSLKRVSDRSDTT